LFWFRIQFATMLWIAPSAKDMDTTALEKRLWDADDQFRANSGLKSQEATIASNDTEILEK
jgi:hypothetical protein